MTSSEISMLHAAWRKSFDVPPGLDPWSRLIATRARDAAWESTVSLQPDFGMSMALAMATRGWEPELVAEPPYRWVRSARDLLKVPDLEHGYDPALLPVRQAIRLDHQPELGGLLNAALLARDATVGRVAAALDFTVPAVDAYTTLYFNVLDRKDDPAFLLNAATASIVRHRRPRAVEGSQQADMELLLAGLDGTVAEVVGMYRRGVTASV